MTETRIVVIGARGAGKQALLDGLCGRLGGRAIDAASAQVTLPGGETLQVRCLAEAIVATSLAGADGLLALVDAAADDAQAQLQACMALLSGPAAALPAVLGISRVDLHPDWDMAATLAALTQAGHALPVVPFDARDPAQGLMLLDVLVSQIETDGLIARAP
jgi:signal recognition particle receptor subunit beta